MCGRYTLARSQQELSERFGIKQLFVDFEPRYNIAPTQKIPLVLKLGQDKILEAYRWGLIPSGTVAVDKSKPLINARAETLMEKKSFKNSFMHRRCLVPTDGFYEWKKEGSQKRPMFIHRADNALFAFGGIWDEWIDDDGASQKSYSIITTAANNTMAPVHDRMPLILEPQAEDLWLDNENTDMAPLLELLRPCPDELITMHEVSPLVNSVKTDNPELIEPCAGQLRLKLF